MRACIQKNLFKTITALKHVKSESTVPSQKGFINMKEILSFHNGVAAVHDHKYGFHVNTQGKPIYSARYQRTFGFYAGERAAVIDTNCKSFHISLSGEPAYDARFEWCGNFHSISSTNELKAPVRKNGSYFYINEHGHILSGPYLYCGDPNSCGESVVWNFDSTCNIINNDGTSWCKSPSTLWLDARVPHKGIAAVQDVDGWFFVDKYSKEMGRGRFEEVEPHYNGFARVKLKSQKWVVINEQGQVVADLGQSTHSSAAELERASKLYWKSLALKRILDSDILQRDKRIEPKTTLEKVLFNISEEMGLIRKDSVTGNGFQLSKKGLLLSSGDVTGDRCRYWLQNRYLSKWVGVESSVEDLQPDVFREISLDSNAVELSQRVLNSYALDDWNGVADKLPILCDAPVTIVDLGGGQGALLQEIECSAQIHPATSLVCVERPEVVRIAQSLVVHSNSRVQFQVGDLFEGPVPHADLYLLSRVLHDWSDERAVSILQHIHNSSPGNSQLCVIDRVCDNVNKHGLLSLHMYLVQRSHERTQSEWELLFGKALWTVKEYRDFNNHKIFILNKVNKPTTTTLPTIFPTSKVPISRLISKAVIPIAGLGSRMAPQSEVTPKALLPIVQRVSEPNPLNNITVKPALEILLDELFSEGSTIRDVCIIASPKQIPLLDIFLAGYKRRNESKEQRSTFTVVVQELARGLGDAVLLSEGFVGNDPFLLALGDHVFSANSVQNILAAYFDALAVCGVEDAVNFVGLTGACLCRKDEISSTGLLAYSSTTILPNRGTPWKVDKMAEKPSHNHDDFELNSSFPGKYASQLGIDVLPPTIFVALKQKKLTMNNTEKELDLRAVMKDYLQKRGYLYASIADSHRLDIGNPKAYIESLQRIYFEQFPVHRKQFNSSGGSHHFDDLKPLTSFLLQLLSMKSLSTNEKHVFSQILSPDLGLVHVGSAPGRMDLMGGFADYSGSRALQCPTALRVFTLVQHKSTNNSTSPGHIHMVAVQVPSLQQVMNKTETGEFVVNVRSAELEMSKIFDSNLSSIIDGISLGEYLRSAFRMSDFDDHWSLYLVGVLRSMLDNKLKQDPSCGASLLETSFNIVTISDLSWNCGLASSAAVETATSIAVGNALGLSATILQPARLALLCQQVEHDVVGSMCGLMDQLAVAHNFEPCVGTSIVGMTCRSPLSSPPTTTISLPQGLTVVAFESGVRRSIAGRPYKRVRTATAVGKAILNEMGKNAKFLCDITPSEFESVRIHLPISISGDECVRKFGHFLPADLKNDLEPTEIYPIQYATAHPIKENFRVSLFESILRSMNGVCNPQTEDISNCHQQLGELMRQSHDSYTKCGLGTTQTDLLVDLLTERPRSVGIIGAKVSGGGNGGAIVALLQNGSNDSEVAAQRVFLRNVQERYLMKTGLQSVFRAGDSSGAARYHGHLCGSRRLLHTTPRDSDSDFVDTYKQIGHSKPRILYVNHGYPPNYNGGSEVYAQTLAIHMRKSGQFSSVHVLAREEDPYRPDFEIRRTVDQLDSELPVLLMNYPREAPYFRFVAEPVDSVFREVMNEIQPDIVHFHHLNHLSLTLPTIAKEYGAAVLYTIHDFWLMCPRGQFLVTGVTSSGSEPWQQCDGQNGAKCARQCYVGRYASGVTSCSSDSGSPSSVELEQEYWTNWIDRRMSTTQTACNSIDYFIAPSKHLYARFIKDFHLPRDKVILEPYGFERNRFSGRQRRNNTREIPYVFAYIGRHQPAKGLNLLVEAALRLLEEGDFNVKPRFQLRIYGRLEANSTRAMQRMISACPHPYSNSLIVWESEYNNADIVKAVFDNVDCIVVPSVWDENAPLVIHEAFQCKVPVITSDRGGMGELVKDSENGLTFEHRSAQSLTTALRKAMSQPDEMQELGNRGYLNSSDGQIPCIKDHCKTIISLYSTCHDKTITDKVGIPSMDVPLPIQKMDSPWRVTFDTNPDDCNFKCTMCEQHSEHSPHQKHRKASGVRRRRMDINIVRDVVRELAPRGLKEIIPTTMGEPLQYKDFPEFLEICREFNVKMNLTTNGSFFGRGVEAWARLIVPLTSDVKISWNGISAETQEQIMKGSNLSRQISNLQSFVRIRDEVARNGGNYCTVTLQLTFMEANLHEIPAIVKFAVDNGCDRVKGHHLWAHFDEIKDENLRRSSQSIRKWNEIASECRDIVVKNPRSNGKLLKLENFFDLDESAVGASAVIHPASVCPFLGKEAWVNHSGRFDPCCAPDEQRKSLGSFGNVKDESILAIWESEQYNDLVKNYLNRPLCRGCNMRKPPSSM